MKFRILALLTLALISRTGYAMNQPEPTDEQVDALLPQIESDEVSIAAQYLMRQITRNNIDQKTGQLARGLRWITQDDQHWYTEQGLVFEAFLTGSILYVLRTPYKAFIFETVNLVKRSEPIEKVEELLQNTEHQRMDLGQIPGWSIRGIQTVNGQRLPNAAIRLDMRTYLVPALLEKCPTLHN